MTIKILPRNQSKLDPQLTFFKTWKRLASLHGLPLPREVTSDLLEMSGCLPLPPRADDLFSFGLIFPSGAEIPYANAPAWPYHKLVKKIQSKVKDN